MFMLVCVDIFGISSQSAYIKVKVTGAKKHVGVFSFLYCNMVAVRFGLLVPAKQLVGKTVR